MLTQYLCVILRSRSLKRIYVYQLNGDKRGCYTREILTLHWLAVIWVSTYFGNFLKKGPTRNRVTKRKLEYQFVDSLALENWYSRAALPFNSASAFFVQRQISNIRKSGSLINYHKGPSAPEVGYSSPMIDINSTWIWLQGLLKWREY